jgi:hypothetical protein
MIIDSAHSLLLPPPLSLRQFLPRGLPPVRGKREHDLICFVFIGSSTSIRQKTPLGFSARDASTLAVIFRNMHVAEHEEETWGMGHLVQRKSVHLQQCIRPTGPEA